MNATTSFIVLNAAIDGDNIIGTAIDGDIKVLFTAVASEVNQHLFVPEANLVVSGKSCLGCEVCTVDISIASVIAVVSLPVASSDEVAPTVERVVISSDAPVKPKRKSSTTRRKTASAKTKPVAA
jgi:hypothetical protein